MPDEPLRIGVTQRVSVIEEYGERRDCLDQAWILLLQELGYTPVPLPNRIAPENVRSYLNRLSIDGVVLTGGNDIAGYTDPETPAPARDAFERAVLDVAVETGLSVVGVCRGLELLNVYFGGDLSAVSDHVDVTHEISFVETNGLSIPETITVNSYHNWGINQDDVAAELTVGGIAPDETVECLFHPSLPIWGIMWHPERDSPSATVDQQILRYVFESDK